MKDLIELFWLRYTELQSAVGKNESDKIAVLERELELLLDRIVGRKTESSEDIREQFRFAIDLLIMRRKILAACSATPSCCELWSIVMSACR
ncbi:hypothetical protein NQG32_11690 [Agrobacterium fabrum]|nr:hypothetical protein [Agrobacterium fabrum]